jgi:hypothetical protein
MADLGNHSAYMLLQLGLVILSVLGLWLASGYH